jgi:18S rRNA (guanine1575-N7)-methyltransferase
MIEVQRELTERALEILAIPAGQTRMLLDIGAGTGISGGVLSEYEHMWVGVDISNGMLKMAANNEENEGDLMLGDMGQGFGFSPGTFDGAISISALQWLCTAEQKCHNPIRRLNKFFQSLYSCLIKGARCAFQFYPSNPEQVEMITNAAMKNGFTGGIIVDYPNSKKAKKYYLFLIAGFSTEMHNEAKSVIFPKAKTGEPGQSDDEMAGGEGDDDSDEDENGRKYKKKEQQVGLFGTKSIKKHHRAKKYHSEFGQVKSKSWILAKKERAKRQGKDSVNDSKYSGRKRSSRF